MRKGNFIVVSILAAWCITCGGNDIPESHGIYAMTDEGFVKLAYSFQLHEEYKYNLPEYKELKQQFKATLTTRLSTATTQEDSAGIMSAAFVEYVAKIIPEVGEFHGFIVNLPDAEISNIKMYWQAMEDMSDPDERSFAPVDISTQHVQDDIYRVVYKDERQIDSGKIWIKVIVPRETRLYGVLFGHKWEELAKQ